MTATAPLAFTVEASDPASAARRGRLRTPHGELETPMFMPVGTQATVKTLSPHEVADLGAQVILANTYHLFLRPGHELVRAAGGLHRFMAWERGILTDSGGFQVFSLAELRTITEEGVTFRSHIDGSLQFLGPEQATQVQNALGADIIMAFDECTPYPCTYEYARASLERTARWAARCREAHGRPHDQALFGIVQGGVYADLRRESARRTVALDFPGYSIGGLSVGEPKAQMYEICALLDGELPRDRPRYLMGVGSPEDLVEGVACGVDMFDCVLPTREARHGAVLTAAGRLNIKNASFARDWAPIEVGCDCYACRHFSRAYIRHLFKAGEVLGQRLCTVHNLRFLLRLMEQARAAIAAGTFTAFRRAFAERWRTRPHSRTAAEPAAPENR